LDATNKRIYLGEPRKREEDVVLPLGECKYGIKRKKTISRKKMEDKDG
jgi:hypothetical protein